MRSKVSLCAAIALLAFSLSTAEVSASPTTFSHRRLAQVRQRTHKNSMLKYARFFAWRSGVCCDFFVVLAKMGTVELPLILFFRVAALHEKRDAFHSSYFVWLFESFSLIKLLKLPFFSLFPPPPYYRITQAPLPSETRPLQPFSSVALCAPLNLLIKPDPGNNYAFTVAAEQAVLPNVKAVVGPDAVLSVTANGPITTNQPIQLTVSLPANALTAIAHNGPSTFFIKRF